MSTLNLMIHTGTQSATLEELRAANTPLPTLTHHPIPHHSFLEGVREALSMDGLDVIDEAHAMSDDSARYFGMMSIKTPTESDHGWIVGVRNSHDKRFASGIVIGSQVIVCDNLSFSGEISMNRKHTSRIMDELPSMIMDTVAQLRVGFEEQDRRYEYYKCDTLTNGETNQLLIKALDDGIISGSQIPKVLKEYRMPSHGEFRSRTVWSLFNAFTEVLKGSSLDSRSLKTRRLHLLLDSFTGCN